MSVDFNFQQNTMNEIFTMSLPSNESLYDGWVQENWDVIVKIECQDGTFYVLVNYDPEYYERRD